MKRELLICVFTFTVVASITDRIYACCEDPVADFSAPTYICIDCVVSFDASGSYDPDGTELSYDWNFGSGAYDVNTTDPVHPTCKYNTAGVKTVILEVTDNDNPDCCNGDPNCSDKESDPNAVETITVVRVDKVVENVSPYTNEGPLYVCPDDSVGLKAIAYPADASFPTGEPHWSIESEPNGSNASLNPSSGSATTTLSGITKVGEYVIKAQCGDSDTGDTIIVITGSTSGYWVNFVPYFACPRTFDPGCDLEWQDYVEDLCTNRITITCFTECYYRYFFNGVEVGKCPWPDAHNQFHYKIDIYDIHFLETWHTSGNNENSSSGAGCDGYYCWRTERYDCINTESIGIWWERDTSPVFRNGKPPPGNSEACPGPIGGGPHPFWPE